MSDEKEKISQFYNEYQVINFSDQDELKSEKKALTKQMDELVNIVLPCLAKIGETDNEMPVGMLLASLVADKLVSEEKFIEVQNKCHTLFAARSHFALFCNGFCNLLRSSVFFYSGNKLILGPFL